MSWTTRWSSRGPSTSTPTRPSWTWRVCARSARWLRGLPCCVGVNGSALPFNQADADPRCSGLNGSTLTLSVSRLKGHNFPIYSDNRSASYLIVIFLWLIREITKILCICLIYPSSLICNMRGLNSNPVIGEQAALLNYVFTAWWRCLF